VASAATPAAASGAPVLAAVSTAPSKDNASAPPDPAASEAFWASSTTSRSR
jgi:hypothetical protein